MRKLREHAHLTKVKHTMWEAMDAAAGAASRMLSSGVGSLLLSRASFGPLRVMGSYRVKAPCFGTDRGDVRRGAVFCARIPGGTPCPFGVLS